jgi:MoxR-like ATPase
MPLGLPGAPKMTLMGVTVEELGPADVAALGSRVAANIAGAVKVPEGVLREVLVALMADGHVLIEDHPGVGKTALARALARSIDADYARIQCTSDLLPSDVVGTNVFNQLDGRFEFRAGPVFAHLVLVDEINRASPRTQSGLLECMQEGRVTVDGDSHPLARPFMVLATQNPVDYEGTYPLPEAQLDRFMVRVSLGYPSPAQEAEMLAVHAGGDRVLDLSPVTSVSEIRRAQSACSEVHASAPLREYVVALVGHTRRDPRVELGASPRAGLMLLKAAKASAVLDGRDHALPDDVQAMAMAVLAHRLMLAPSAVGTVPEQVVRETLTTVRAL